MEKDENLIFSSVQNLKDYNSKKNESFKILLQLVNAKESETLEYEAQLNKQIEELTDFILQNPELERINLSSSFLSGSLRVNSEVISDGMTEMSRNSDVEVNFEKQKLKLYGLENDTFSKSSENMSGDEKIENIEDSF